MISSEEFERKYPSRWGPPGPLSIVLRLAVLAVLFRLAWAHAGALIVAGALGISFHPLKLWIWRRLPRLCPSFHAGLTSLLVVLFFVVPLLSMVWATVAQAENWLPVARAWRETVGQWRESPIIDPDPSMSGVRLWAREAFKASPAELRSEGGRIVEKALDSMVDAAAKLPAAMASSLLEAGLMMVALFFVFRDGETLYDRIQDYLPLSGPQKAATRERVSDVVTDVIRGWLLCAVMQGVMASVAYGLAGVKGWTFFGFMTMLAGLIPFVGTALVWIPLSAVQFYGGHVWSGIFLTLWGFFVIGLTDNFLRPYLVGRRIDIPFVFLFFALLGGFDLWGVKGALLGPVLLALAPVILLPDWKQGEAAPSDTPDVSDPPVVPPGPETGKRPMPTLRGDS